MNNSITDIPGIAVGHWTNLEAITGCTAILCPTGSLGGVSVRGASPGTRETDVLHPSNRVDEIHAIMLSGGSAYGLAAADGATNAEPVQAYVVTILRITPACFFAIHSFPRRIPTRLL